MYYSPSSISVSIFTCLVDPPAEYIYIWPYPYLYISIYIYTHTCFADNPAESPSTMKISLFSGSPHAKSASFPITIYLSIYPSI